MIWQIPLQDINSLNSALVKLVALSETMVSGRPCIANIVFWGGGGGGWIVISDDVEGTITTSSHLEWASTTNKNVFSMNGPAWSMCIQS